MGQLEYDQVLLKRPIPEYNNPSFLNYRDQIIPAFWCGDKPYYQFTNELGIPYERMVAAKDIYEELEWGISKSNLTAMIKAHEALCIDKRKTADQKVLELAIVISRLKDRMELPFSVTIEMKMSTVKYIDNSENILSFDHGHAKAKMDLWMKNNDVPGFFLNLPLLAYLPSGKELEKNLNLVLQGESLMILKELNHHIMLMPSTEENKELKKTLLSQMETYQSMIDWSR